MWLVSDRYQATKQADRFGAYWEDELKIWRENLKKEKERKEKGEPAETPAEQPSLTRAMRRYMFWTLAPIGILKFISDLCTTLSPLILRYIVNYVNTGGSSSPLYEGIIYIIILFVLNILGTIFMVYFFHLATTAGLMMRTALSVIIYRKSLKLSAATRAQDFNAGKVMNVVSTDCQRVEMFIMFMHIIWTAPLQILMITGFLIAQLGPAAIAGVGLLFLLTPLQGTLWRQLATIRKIIAPITDSRVKLMQEILQGIRVIKFFTWEDSFLKKIEEYRGQEMKQVFKRA
ncbi:hypothetical protein HK102_003018 [Quaeritorhiza haematococci]|nr:hypothetical protein HK102_003018 [Quaeritorhiza haematococci]